MPLSFSTIFITRDYHLSPMKATYKSDLEKTCVYENPYSMWLFCKMYPTRICDMIQKSSVLERLGSWGHRFRFICAIWLLNREILFHSYAQYLLCDDSYLHGKLLGVQQVSNPSIGNQRISTLAHSLWYKCKMIFSSELVVQINIKGFIGVEIPPARSFWCGVWSDSFIC